MLVLTRKVGESAIIAGNITIKVLEVVGHRVRLGIQAPARVTVLREELILGDAREDRIGERDTAPAG
jgi:carbon storage regulator